MNDRRVEIHEAKDATCEWIWSTKFGQWLEAPEENLFWISGKPGSGKSTLMKYLAKPGRLEEKLPKGVKPWRVLSFFFDFQFGDKVANSVEGLLRSFLVEILKDRRDIAARMGLLTIDWAFEKDTVSWRQRFDQAITLIDRRFIVLIDGLDEFAGKKTSLLEVLTGFQEHSNLKLCLASRPEAMIRYVLESYPNLQMSVYNSPGIQQYLNLSIKRFRPLLDALQLQDIQGVIHERAQGVFLWVYLAIEDVLQACADGATATEVKERLNLLPTELRDLYKRILDRLPAQRRAEAAILFTLVDDARYPITVGLLHGAFQFLAQELLINPLPNELIGLDGFERRLHSTTGGLIEVSPGASDAEGSSLGTRTVRLIHQTVRAFAAESSWPGESLPSPFQLMFPNCLWGRLCCEALLAGDKKVEATPRRVLQSWFAVNKEQNMLQGSGEHVQYNAFDIILQRRLPGSGLLSWTRLLWHSIKFIVLHADEDMDVNPTVKPPELETAMRSRWVGVRLALWQHYSTAEIAPTQDIVDSDHFDLFIAAMHRGYRYLETNHLRLALLNDQQRGGLVATMMLMPHLSFTRVVDPYKNTRNKQDKSGALRHNVDMVLTLNHTVSSFDLAVFLHLGYKDVPGYLNLHLREGRSPRQERVRVPCWDPVRHLLAAELPLFIWACEASITSEADCTFEKQLRVLLDFGADIHSQSSQGYNIVHYLITEHMVNHTFLIETDTCLPDDDLANAIEKLYLVEKAGANFRSRFEGRTALEALQQGYDQVKQSPEDELLFELNEAAIARFAQLEFMLEHKEQTGHLPLPLMGTNYRRKKNLSTLNQNVTKRRCDLCTVIARRGSAGTRHSRIPRWKPRPGNS